MKWTTWRNVGIDRIACAWLIRKRIDPKAEFVFIPHGSMDLPKGTTPFDLPGVKLSHRRGHCTFHTLLRQYKLKDPILDRIARIVDEADTVQAINVEPASAGLDMICDGLRNISKDDHQAIARGALLFDALYATLSGDTAKLK